MFLHFPAHKSPQVRVFSVSLPSPPSAYRAVQNRFTIKNTTFFQLFSRANRRHVTFIDGRHNWNSFPSSRNQKTVFLSS